MPTILIVEADGYAVTEAGDGKEVVDSILAQGPALMLFDIDAP